MRCKKHDLTVLVVVYFVDLCFHDYWCYRTTQEVYMCSILKWIKELKKLRKKLDVLYWNQCELVRGALNANSLFDQNIYILNSYLIGID